MGSLTTRPKPAREHVLESIDAFWGESAYKSVFGFCANFFDRSCLQLLVFNIDDLLRNPSTLFAQTQIKQSAGSRNHS